MADVPEDLTTQDEEEEVEEEEYEVETTSRIDLIAAAYNSIAALDCFDQGMLIGEDGRRARRIRRKSLAIIDIVICELYDELSEVDEDD